MPAQVQVYTKDHCPYCESAKKLLRSKGVAFEEINMQNRPDELVALKKRTGLMTVPQIFINGQLIGGFSELSVLEQKKELDALLAAGRQYLSSVRAAMGSGD